MYKEFWSLFIHGYGRIRITTVIMVVTVLGSLLEGINIGLLLPLLENLGATGGSDDHWISRLVSRVFDSLSIPFQLETILLALGVVLLAVASLKYLRLILVARTRQGFLVWLRSMLMQNLLHTDVRYFHKERMGTLTNTLTIQAEDGSSTFAAITEMISGFGIVTAYMLAAFLISPVLTAVAFGMIILVTLAMQSRIKRARSIGENLVRRNQDLQTASLESLSDIRTVKAFRLEQNRLTDFNNKATDLGEGNFQQNRNSSQVIVLQETALFALVGAIVYVGVALLSLEIAIIVTVLFILYRLAPRVTTLNSMRGALAATMTSLRQVKSMIDETAVTSIIDGDRAFTELNQGIEFRGVDFSYDGETPVLKGASFSIEKGQMTALVGTSGAGKTTLVDLILRFHDPVDGSILVDGVDLREFTLESWRKTIGIVNQDIFLFNDTIYNNIAVGLPDSTKEQVVEAAKGAFADEFIRQLPKGYDTLVGERGWNLSGGQRQRIALARAILRRPQILILDEATSSLDSESEQLIQQYISGIRGNITLLVVAHRMSTIQDADKIVVLENGRITEEGNWDSLLAESGVFANYIRLQSGALTQTEAND